MSSETCQNYSYTMSLTGHVISICLSSLYPHIIRRHVSMSTMISFAKTLIANRLDCYKLLLIGIKFISQTCCTEFRTLARTLVNTPALIRSRP